MAHQFTIYATLQGIGLDDFQRLVAKPSLHEAVCRRISGSNLEIIESHLDGDIYTLNRHYDIDINLPDVAKKLVKGAFRIKRHEVIHLKSLSSTVALGANLPLYATSERHVSGDNHQIDLELHWNVQVKIPLLGAMLEKHAEQEIRRLSQFEIRVIEDELKKHLLVAG